MRDTITTTSTQEVQWRLIDTKCGIRRSVFLATRSLLLFLDEFEDQKLFIAENTLQSADAQQRIDFEATIDGNRITCHDLTRCRSAHWLVSGTPRFNKPGLLRDMAPQAFALDWYEDKPLHTAPVIPPGQSFGSTGGARRHGCRTGWCEYPDIVIAQTLQTYPSFPLMLRDPDSFRFIRNPGAAKGCITFGPLFRNVLAPPSGMKIDTMHVFSAFEAYLASKKTVYQRRAADIVTALAVFPCVHGDYSGQTYNKPPRAAGRTGRSIADAVIVARELEDTEIADWLYSYLLQWWEYFESQAGDIATMLSINRAIRIDEKTGEGVLAGFEFAQLMFGLEEAAKLVGKRSTYQYKYLKWHIEQADGLTPYELAIKAPSGRWYSRREILAIEKEKADAARATNSSADRYSNQRAEDYVFNVLRAKHGLPISRTLDDPVYESVLNTPNGAGFAIPFRVVRFLVDGQAFTDVGKARENARNLINKALDDWSGNEDFSRPVQIIRTSEAFVVKL